LAAKGRSGPWGNGDGEVGKAVFYIFFRLSLDVGAVGNFLSGQCVHEFGRALYE
jgi:hypothetical protein